MAKFTFCSEFSPDTVRLGDVVRLIESANGDVASLEKAIRVRYFTQKPSARKRNPKSTATLAMNARISMTKYGLIKVEKGSFSPTSLFYKIKTALESGEDGTEILATHILANLDGLPLIVAIRSLEKTGLKLTRENIDRELTRLGYVNTKGNSKAPGAMVQWLTAAKVFDPAHILPINWKSIEKLVGLEEKAFDEIYQLTSEQFAFYRSLVLLAKSPDEWIESNVVRRHTEATLGVSLTSKSLVSAVVTPLELKGFLTAKKQDKRGGQGGKPHLVRLVRKFAPTYLKEISGKLYGIPEEYRIASFFSITEILSTLESSSKHKKGLALEQLAIWLVRLLGLRFKKWRKRSEETGGAEVDLTAEGFNTAFLRWQFQCKNQKSLVGVATIAKEAGVSLVTRANVLVFVTTSRFSTKALSFASKISRSANAQVVCVDGDDLSKIAEDPPSALDIFRAKALQVAEDDDNSLKKIYRAITKRNATRQASDGQLRATLKRVEKIRSKIRG